MKFNLKNRPKWKLAAIEEWFEGFEKELREALPDESHVFSKDQIWLIKEILGE